MSAAWLAAISQPRRRRRARRSTWSPSEAKPSCRASAIASSSSITRTVRLGCVTLATPRLIRAACLGRRPRHRGLRPRQRRSHERQHDREGAALRPARSPPRPGRRGPHDVAHDRQAEARRPRTSCTRLVPDPVEALEDAFLLVARDADALVADRDDGLVAATCQTHDDVAGLPRVLDRVLEEVAQGLVDRLPRRRSSGAAPPPRSCSSTRKPRAADAAPRSPPRTRRTSSARSTSSNR